MKLTLNDCMQRINQTLNYPSVAYEDISHFFDTAISELNTILKIALPSVSEMVSNNSIDATMQENTVLLEEPIAQYIPTTPVVPTAAPGYGNPTFVKYYDTRDPSSNSYYIWQLNEWRKYDDLYGVCFNNFEKTAYKAISVGADSVWIKLDLNENPAFDLCKYMPFEWWILFVIPYVCFKFAVRNGDSGELYSSEFTQGLQQLQTCYDVPNFVTLSEVAGNPVYSSDVQNNLQNLLKTIPTKAITDSMRVGNAVQAVFGSIFDTGGWGV